MAAVIGASIHDSGPLHGLWFNVPSGDGIGYIEPHAILHFTSGLGLVVFVATGVIRH